MISLVKLAAEMNKRGAARTLHYTFEEGHTWFPKFDNKEESLNDENFLADGPSQLIADLLGDGAKVIKLAPPNTWAVAGVPYKLNGTQIPLANFIQFPDGSIVLCGDIAEVGKYGVGIPDLDEQCGREQMLSYTIPGSVVSDECAKQIANSKDAQIDISTAKTADPVLYIPPQD